MKRIQQRRGVPGWRKPLGARSVVRRNVAGDGHVGTPRYWGNPYRIIEHGGEYTREQAIALFRRDIEQMTPEARREWLAPLRNATYLMCYCSLDEPCHADVLIEWLEAD